MLDAICVAGGATCLAYAIYMLARPCRPEPASNAVVLALFALEVALAAVSFYFGGPNPQAPVAALTISASVAVLATMVWTVLAAPQRRTGGSGGGPGWGRDDPPPPAPDPTPGGIEFDWDAFDTDRAAYTEAGSRELTHA